MAQIYGVLGHPIAHSLSPAMFEAAFFEYGMHDSEYKHFDIEEKNLESFLKKLRTGDSSVSGLSVTIPYKEVIAGWTDKLDEKAKIIGAVNTLVRTDIRAKTKGGVAHATLSATATTRADAKIQWKGFNTDWIGAQKALEEATSLEGKQVVVLGAGGSAAAIVYACVVAGAYVTILNRDVEKARQLVEKLQGLAQSEALFKKGENEKSAAVPELVTLNYGGLEEILSHPADILIHTTSIGMWPNVNVSLVPAEYFKKGMIVFDIVYNPLQTKLVKEASAVGCKIVPGYKMLLYQAEKQFELWFKKKAPVHAMEKALLKALQEKN